MTFELLKFDLMTILLMWLNTSVAGYVLIGFVGSVFSWIKAGPSLDKS